MSSDHSPGPDHDGATDPDTGEAVGELDDAQEAAETSSTTDGPAAQGDYDPAQGSPTGAHPVAESFPQEDPRHDA